MTTTETTTPAPKESRPKRTKATRQAKGLKIKNADQKWWQYEITPKKIKPVELMNFSRQASSFISAGIPLLDALQTIAADSSSKRMNTVLTDVANRVQDGERFSVAMSAHDDVFPAYYLSMLGAAELTGQLDETLDRLASYLERDIEAKRKITSALTYPSIVSLLAVATVIILAVFVLPRFKVFFASLDAKLPLVTRMLLALTDGFIRLWPVLAGLVLIFLILLLVGLKTEGGRKRLDAILLKLPQVGTLIRFVMVERFCRIMGSMVTAGVPLPDALGVAGHSTTNKVFERGLTDAREEMLRGSGFSAPIGATGLFPSAANQMMRVGEATGTLDTQLMSASTYYERELNYRLKRFTDMFEPAIIIVVGFVVGFVAIALVSAMYGIYNQVQV